MQQHQTCLIVWLRLGITRYKVKYGTSILCKGVISSSTTVGIIKRKKLFCLLTARYLGRLNKHGHYERLH